MYLWNLMLPPGADHLESQSQGQGHSVVKVDVTRKWMIQGLSILSMCAVTCIKQKLQSWLKLASLDRDRRRDLKQYVPGNSTRDHKKCSTNLVFLSPD